MGTLNFKKLRVLRTNKGLTQEQVAEKLGISIPAYSKIETGITNMDMSRLAQIAAFHGLTCTELIHLMSGDEIPESENKKMLDEIEELKNELSIIREKYIKVLEELTSIKCPHV